MVKNLATKIQVNFAATLRLGCFCADTIYGDTLTRNTSLYTIYDDTLTENTSLYIMVIHLLEIHHCTPYMVIHLLEIHHS